MVKKVGMDDSAPLVSVILPFYNAPYLKDAIDSILNQTYSNFELILIDNGSTDDSVNVAKSFIDHPQVRLEIEHRRGVVYAANKGIELAKGSFISRMDADDIAQPLRIHAQVEHVNKYPTLQVVSGLIEYLGPHENQGFIQYVDWLNSIRSSDEIRINQFVEFPIANPTMMLRREVFEQCGRFKEGEFPEDYEFFLRLQAANVKMAKVNDVVLSWRDTEERLTRTDDRYSQDAFFRIKAKYLAKWLSRTNPFHPVIYVWGAGRLSRRRSDYLLQEGIDVVKYIDFKENDKVIHYQDIPNASEAFIVSYVANRGARDNIRQFLNQKGYEEGLNYIIAS